MLEGSPVKILYFARGVWLFVLALSFKAPAPRQGGQHRRGWAKFILPAFLESGPSFYSQHSSRVGQSCSKVPWRPIFCA